MPVTNLVSRIREQVARALVALPSDAAVVVAFSGGPDSTCLADAVAALASATQPSPIRLVLAHLHHGLRGPDADADAEFARAFARERGLTYVVERIDVRTLAADRRQSIELAAREVRYEFLARVAVDVGAGHILAGHHADDQAETVLLRIVRGAGLDGLRAMQPDAPVPGAPTLRLLRPLLSVTRAEIERYCADLALAPRHDASNDDADAARNRVRHEVLPLLEQLNPGVRQVLARLADSANADQATLEHATAQACDALVTGGVDGALRVDRFGWRALPLGLRRAVLRECTRRLRPEQGMRNLNFNAVEEARAVLESDADIGEIALLADVRIRVQHRVFVVHLR